MSERWKVALHESAHAVAALVLGGTCERLAIYTDDTGLASIGELSPFDLAVARKAASIAEETLADVPAPPEPEPWSAHARSDACNFAPHNELAVLAACVPREAILSDDAAVARFCIDGLECEPERWANRYYTISAVAHRVVADHRQRILSVARALFARGVLSEYEIRREFEKA